MGHEVGASDPMWRFIRGFCVPLSSQPLLAANQSADDAIAGYVTAGPDA